MQNYVFFLTLVNNNSYKYTTVVSGGVRGKEQRKSKFFAETFLWPKFLFLLKETETNFCLFGFGLAETESLLQISSTEISAEI